MSDLREIRLGTRGSQLALWQAHTVASRIAAAGGPPCRIVTVKTAGDRLQEAPLSEIGGKRLFVKEIEDALLRDEVDIAVHSSKDMPAVLPDDLVIVGVLPREDPRDAVVLPRASSGDSAGPPQIATLEQLCAVLTASASIGTGSVRRIAQLLPIFAGGRFAPIRGNLDTRLRKLDEGSYDALILAAAGLRRLGFAARISFVLPADVCVPAPGQGIVAIEARIGDRRVHEIVSRIDDGPANAALVAERALVEALGGGCQTPIGALATPFVDASGLQLELIAAVASLDGSHVVRGRARGRHADAKALGTQVAAQLVAGGAAQILAAATRAESGSE